MKNISKQKNKCKEQRKIGIFDYHVNSKNDSLWALMKLDGVKNFFGSRSKSTVFIRSRKMKLMSFFKYSKAGYEAFT